jgi:digeranylgeranylglycerophospholipid reductase
VTAAEKVDIVIVGAGPAGSTAAEHAALAGLDVLIIEKRKAIGVPVRCGEFLPHADEVQRIFPQATDIKPLFDLPPELHCVETSAIRIFSPKLTEWELPFHGFTTERDRFDQYLAKRAERAGARILTGESCDGVEKGAVLTGSRRIEAKVIIGADGPLSLVGKKVGLERSYDLCPAITAEARGDFGHVPEMYFGNLAPGGYAWIIPKRTGANVGLGFSRRYQKRTLSQYFADFIAFKHLDVGRPSGKMVPMSGPIPRTVAGDALLVGDAAGQVMPVNGGGIPIALICGRIAGRAAADFVKKGTDLDEYEREWRRQVGGPLRTAVHTKSLASLAFGSRWRLEWAMRFLGPRRMGKAIRCQSVFP